MINSFTLHPSSRTSITVNIICILVSVRLSVLFGSSVPGSSPGLRYSVEIFFVLSKTLYFHSGSLQTRV